MRREATVGQVRQVRQVGQVGRVGLVILVALAAWGPAAALGAAFGAAPRAGETTPTLNPHWREALCDTCHAKQPDGKVDGKKRREATFRENCNRCHTPDALNRRLHHPIDLPVSVRVAIPAGWPQSDGRLACETCHDVLRQCRMEMKERWKNRSFLRSQPGASAVEFCLSCHPQELYRTSSPHDQMDEQRRERAGVCLQCHTQRPEVSGLAAGTTVTLRAPIVELCGSCHGTFPHPIGIPHLAVVKRDMLDRLCAYDILEEFAIPLPRLQRYMKGINRMPRILPVNPKTHEATCVTCHNPHEAGVFPAGSFEARGAEGDTARNFRLRLPEEEMCLSCHNM